MCWLVEDVTDLSEEPFAEVAIRVDPIHGDTFVSVLVTRDPLRPQRRLGQNVVAPGAVAQIFEWAVDTVNSADTSIRTDGSHIVARVVQDSQNWLSLNGVGPWQGMSLFDWAKVESADSIAITDHVGSQGRRAVAVNITKAGSGQATQPDDPRCSAYANTFAQAASAGLGPCSSWGVLMENAVASLPVPLPAGTTLQGLCPQSCASTANTHTLTSQHVTVPTFTDTRVTGSGPSLVRLTTCFDAQDGSSLHLLNLDIRNCSSRPAVTFLPGSIGTVTTCRFSSGQASAIVAGLIRDMPPPDVGGSYGNPYAQSAPPTRTCMAAVPQGPPTTVHIDDVRFSDIQSVAGAVVVLKQSTVYISDSVFISNTAIGANAVGGAISSYGTLRVDHTAFNANVADRFCGGYNNQQRQLRGTCGSYAAINSIGTNYVELHDTPYGAEFGWGNGGAIFAVGNYTVLSSTFEQNMGNVRCADTNFLSNETVAVSASATPEQYRAAQDDPSEWSLSHQCPCASGCYWGAVEQYLLGVVNAERGATCENDCDRSCGTAFRLGSGNSRSCYSTLKYCPDSLCRYSNCVPRVAQVCTVGDAYTAPDASSSYASLLNSADGNGKFVETLG